MKKLKLSPWHKMSEPPTKVGLYKLKQSSSNKLIWSWWDVIFHGAWSTKEGALEERDWDGEGCSILATAWRGVLK